MAVKDEAQEGSQRGGCLRYLGKELLCGDDAKAGHLQLHRVGSIVQDLAVDEQHLVVGHPGRIDQNETVSTGNEDLLVTPGAKAAAGLNVEPEDGHAGMPHSLPQRLGLEAGSPRVSHGNFLLLHADCDRVNAVQAL